MDRMIELLHDHAAASFDKQLHFGEQLPSEWNWTMDVEKGILTIKGSGIFGKKYRSPIQILGTESFESGTWLWSWANEASGIPERLLLDSKRLRALGEKENVAAFMHPKLQLEEGFADTILLLAAGYCRATAYFRGDYDSGRVFLLIKDSEFQRKIENPAHRVASVFPQVLEAVDLEDHKRAFRCYLRFYGFQIQEGQDSLKGKIGHEALTAKFDNQNRLVELATA